MGLEWVRMDTNIGTHDKVIDLLSRTNGSKAFVLYMSAMGWSGGQQTDGLIPAGALGINHGTRKLADLLVDVRLWVHAENGAYRFPTWERRQEPAFAREYKRTSQRMSALKTNCIRWHGKDCGCWQRDDGGDSDGLRVVP